MKKRLDVIINMSPSCGTVADIGCDHGKVAVGLLLRGKAKKAICTDISEKSLNKARRSAESEGLSDSVSFRAGDGLEVIKPGEADVAVIAGMGGDLIAHILEAGKSHAPGMLVLGCNTKPEKARGWLCDNGYIIADEDIVQEGKHFYPVILAVKGVSRNLSETELELGPVLLLKKTPEFIKYVQRKIEKALLKRADISDSGTKNEQVLLRRLDDKIKKYEEAIV